MVKLYSFCSQFKDFNSCLSYCEKVYQNEFNTLDECISHFNHKIIEHYKYLEMKKQQEEYNIHMQYLNNSAINIMSFLILIVFVYNVANIFYYYIKKKKVVARSTVVDIREIIEIGVDICGICFRKPKKTNNNWVNIKGLFMHKECFHHSIELFF